MISSSYNNAWRYDSAGLHVPSHVMQFQTTDVTHLMQLMQP